MIIIKYAFLPKIVKTWRPKGTKAIIWFQHYNINKDGAYCLKLRRFSYEFKTWKK